MRIPNKVQIGSIVVATFLVGYFSAAGLNNKTTQAVDLPPVLLAEAASVDYYLKIEGVEGESADDAHKGQIEIQSFSWGVSNLGSTAMAGGAGAGKASFSNLNIMKLVDKASPVLFQSAAAGEHFSSAVMTLADSDSRQEFMKVTLSDVIISSYQTKGSTGSMPMESFKLNFSKIEFEYTPQKADGSMDATVRAGYDVAANKKV
jgi:type VI secretion system secreted protein Hcp